MVGIMGKRIENSEVAEGDEQSCHGTCRSNGNAKITPRNIATIINNQLTLLFFQYHICHG
jgi:hypothetical protein